jgi:hypothetical protein
VLCVHSRPVPGSLALQYAQRSSMAFYSRIRVEQEFLQEEQTSRKQCKRRKGVCSVFCIRQDLVRRSFCRIGEGWVGHGRSKDQLWFSVRLVISASLKEGRPHNLFFALSLIVGRIFAAEKKVGSETL